MDLNLIQQTLETYFATNWTDTKYTFQDIPFADGTEPTADESWVRMVIVYGVSESLEMSKSGTGLRNGTINFEIFTPVDDPRIKFTIAKNLEALFRKKSISRIVTNEPYTTVTATTITVVAPFHNAIGE